MFMMSRPTATGSAAAAALLLGVLLACGRVATAAPANSSEPPNGDAVSAIPAGNEELPAWAHRLKLSSRRSGSVSIWLGVCSDLCRAGLGGTPCGPTCVAATPDTTMMGMRVSGVKSRPREEVCPILCRNNLGYPLCECTFGVVIAGTPDWMGICHEFCNTQGMTLTGCPLCIRDRPTNRISRLGHKQTESATPTKLSGGARRSDYIRVVESALGKLGKLSDKTVHFNDADIGGTDWEEWCNLVCKTGDGGAACNCDLAPLY